MLALSTVACSSPVAQERVTAVWADDDTGWAVAREWFDEEGRPLDDAVTRTGAEHEIAIRGRDQLEHTVLVTRRSGNVGAIYYMRSAAYVLVRAAGQYEVVDLDGGTRPLPEGGAYVPSPDGSVLARHHVRECAAGDSEGDIRTCTVAIEFWNPFEVTKQAQEQVSLRVGGGFGVDVLWTPDDTLLVADFETTMELKPGEPVRTGVERPRCFDPATSSSDLAADGTRVIAEIANGDVRLRTEAAEEQGWPQHCLPGKL